MKRPVHHHAAGAAEIEELPVVGRWVKFTSPQKFRLSLYIASLLFFASYKSLSLFTLRTCMLRISKVKPLLRRVVMVPAS